MSKPRLILCSGASPPVNAPVPKPIVLRLTSRGTNANVHINVMNVAKVYERQLSPRLKDLLEIAAYIYSADCGVERGDGWDDGHSTERWGRQSHFVIPVRDHAFWNRAEVQTQLSQILRFLADDIATFEFTKADWHDQDQLYLEFGDNADWPCKGLDRVLMFSGGLDSLAGAVQTAASGEAKGLVLVSHRPVSTLDSRQRNLVKELVNRFPLPLVHVPVWVNKHGLGRESTQRTRSFLFAALGTAVAEGVEAGGVRFFENGVVSLNLPVADEVLRARASRTTHPVSLKLFTDFFSLVANRPLVFDNPFVFQTKTEVVSVIGKYYAGELIAHSCSCSHQMFKSKHQLHCGTCSQCIDRRIAVIAAGLDAHDSPDDYETDVFTGPRQQGYEKNMAVDFARHAMELSKMSDTAMLVKFNMELSRAAGVHAKPSYAASQFVEMFRRHGETVSQVLRKQVSLHAASLLAGELDDTCLLSLVCSRQHHVSSWRRCVERIGDMLQKGLPRACKSNKPKDEKHLQEICDGILKSNDGELEREYPFMPWASVLTKPDWSVEELCLWVELKYVRKAKDIHAITEAIAADITKYGDNGRRVLFAVYDPSHLVVDENKFSRDISARETMFVRFIR